MNKSALKDIIDKPITREWGSEGDCVNILRTTNFRNDGTLDFENVVKRDISKSKVKQKARRIGDIIIEKSGGSPNQPVGRVVYFESDGVFLCNNFTSILRSKSHIVHSKYLFYILFANHKFGITNGFQNKTTGIINLQLPRYIENIKIPLPPLPEQQRIAAILDAADALRKKTQQIIDSYDELAQSVFLDMFGDPVKNEKGWEENELSNLCVKKDDIKCGPFGTQLSKSEYISEGVPIWGIPQVNSQFLKPPTEFISDLKARQLSTYSVDSDDIVMSRKGNVGTCAIYPKHWKPGILHSDVLRIRCDINAINPIYLVWQFRINRKLQTQVANVSSGAIMAGINVTKLKSITPQIPPISLQNQFAQKIELIEKQKDLAKQSLKESEDLFQSLLQKAFKGELNN